MPKTCIAKSCTSVPTHVLVTETHTWRRVALLASAVPPYTRGIGRGDQAPAAIPYLCATHAKEKETV